jgi:hypothetical protein
MELTFTGKLTRNEIRRLQFNEIFRGSVTISFIVGMTAMMIVAPVIFCLIGYCKIVEQRYFTSDFFGLGISCVGLAFFITCAIFFGAKEAEAATTVRLTPTSVSIDTPGVSQLTLPVEKIRFKFHRMGFIGRSGRTLVFALPYRVLPKNEIIAIKNMYGLK